MAKQKNINPELRKYRGKSYKKVDRLISKVREAAVAKAERTGTSNMSYQITDVERTSQTVNVAFYRDLQGDLHAPVRPYDIYLSVIGDQLVRISGVWVKLLTRHPAKAHENARNGIVLDARKPYNFPTSDYPDGVEPRASVLKRMEESKRFVEEKKAARKAALAKLTPEDRIALGVEE